MRKHLAGASYLFVADIGARALNFVAVAWLARMLAPESYGAIVIGASALDYALLLCDWGLRTLGTRETAMAPAARRFDPPRIAAARIALSLAILVVSYVVIALAAIEPEQSAIIRIYLLGIVPYALMIDWYHQGSGRFLAITASRVAGSMLLVAGVTTLVASPADAGVVPWLYVASMSVTTVALLLVRRGERVVPYPSELAASPEVVRAASPLGVAAIFGQSFVVLPPLVAGWLLGASDAGMLYAALRLVMIALIVDRVFAALYLPALARAWSEDRARGIARLDGAFRIVVAVGVGASMVSMIFAAELVDVIFGDRYAAAADVLAWLAPFIAVTLVNTFFSYGLIAIGEERLYLRTGIRSGLLFLVLLLAATPLFGLRGIAAATVLGEIAMSVWLFAMFRRHVPLRPLRPLAVSLAVATAMVVGASAGGATALWLAPVVVAAFAGAVLLLGGVELNDLRATS